MKPTSNPHSGCLGCRIEVLFWTVELVQESKLEHTSPLLEKKILSRWLPFLRHSRML